MKNNIITNNVIMHSLLFGFGFPIIARVSGSDIIISFFIGTIFNIVIIALFSKIQPLKIFKVIINILVIIIYLKIVANFITNFYLINLPPFVVYSLVLLLAFYIICQKEDIVKRVCFSMTFINILLFISLTIVLTKSINYEHFLPIYTHSLKTITLGGLFYSSITVIPYLHLQEKKSLKEDYLTLLVSSIITLIFFILTLGILGPNYIVIYRFPEYMMLKEINLFAFIANVHNIFAFIFGNELIISIIIYLNNLKKLFITK